MKTHKLEIIDNSSGKSRMVFFSDTYYKKLEKSFKELNSGKLIYV